jgi:hypothetical protein
MPHENETQGISDEEDAEARILSHRSTDDPDVAREPRRVRKPRTEQGISEQCPHGNPTCPCPDGDWCHYEDDPETGTKAMRCPTPGHCDAGQEER